MAFQIASDITKYSKQPKNSDVEDLIMKSLRLIQSYYVASLFAIVFISF